MAEVSTDNPFLSELIDGLHVIASIPTDNPDPRNGGSAYNAERNAYALEAIGHGLATVAYEVSQLREDQRTANLIAIATGPSDLRAQISEAQLDTIYDQILDNLGIGEED